MGGKRTLDNLKFGKVFRAVENFGVEVRRGTKHPYILVYQGMRPCPVAATTDARTMIAPWLAEATGMTKQDAYTALRS